MTREEAKKLATELVSKMTVEEKAGQLRFDAPGIPRLHVPEYNWWNEALHGIARGGTATVFPQSIGLGAMFDPELLEKIGEAASTEARAKYNAVTEFDEHDIYRGLTVWSPNVNIFRDPRWGRGQETYGEDPYLTAECGKAYVRGLQGKGEHLRTAACAKHFAVHSGPESLRHEFDAKATPKDMTETYLYAFKALVEDAGVESVMGAYNRTNGEPCCASDALMEKLRGEWGFEGHFLSDCWAIRDFHEHHKITGSPAESVTKALKAGCDLNCGCTYQHVMDAYRAGMISEEDITRSAIRLFTTRYLLGIMGNGSEYDEIDFTEIESKEHLALAEKAALESCVLLQNDGILPLKKEKLKTVGVIGPNANSRTALIGNYHGTSSRYITVLEGIQDECQKEVSGQEIRVLYSEGSHLYKEKIEHESRPGDRITEALSVARRSDVVILVVGLDETLEGEENSNLGEQYTGDKKDLYLPACQRLLTEKVLELKKPTVMVLMSGSAIDISAYTDRLSAVLLGWYPGARGGKAVADLLFGNASPSGKLPVTFYRNDSLEEMPAFTDYTLKNRTYRYFKGDPLYPFGYGLTYAKFNIEKTAVTGNKAEVLVKNESDIPSDNVLQVYTKAEGSAFAPENPVLSGFKRIHLEAGEEKSFTVEISPDAFTVVNNEGERIPAEEKVTVLVRF